MNRSSFATSLMFRSTIIFLFFFLFFFFHMSVFASSDMTVSCTSDVCHMFPDNVPMFNESNWVPGQSVSRVIHATNDTKNDALFAIEGKYTGTGDLGDALLISIKEDIPNGNTIYRQSTLSSFLSKGFIPLTSIKKNKSEEYLVTVMFDPLAGNEFQGTDTQFSLTLGFGLVPEKKVDDVIRPSESTQKSNDESVNHCKAIAPGTAPVVSFASHSPNTVLLSWTSVSPVTHYVVSFRRQSDGAEYGSPNVGNVTSYTITNIPGDSSYSFSVFGVNDCMPGERGSISGVPMGSMVLGKPEGENHEVFALKNVETDSSSFTQSKEVNDLSPVGLDNRDTRSGSVLGTSTQDDPTAMIILCCIYTVLSFVITILLHNKKLLLCMMIHTAYLLIMLIIIHIYFDASYVQNIYLVLIFCMQPLVREYLSKNMRK